MHDGTLGSLLRRLRTRAGLTLEQLAEAADLSDRAIGDLERGVSRAPRVGTIDAIAAALRLAPADRDALADAARAGRQRDLIGAATVTALPLPRVVADFTGRADELSTIRGHAGRAGDRTPVLLISGPPGIGKTSLAVQAATELAEAFPDGRYFLDLQGFAAQPLSVIEVLSRLIRAVAPETAALPRRIADASALWRRVSSGRRIVVVLDNAADEAAVQAALPGDGPGLVIVTSRRLLSALDGVDRLPLPPLAEPESVALLGRMTASREVATDDLRDLAQLCAHMPLAMRVAANRLTARRRSTARDLIVRLADQERRLNVLTAGDLQVNAAFALSYDQLSPGARRLFRRLSMAAGPTTGIQVAAVLVQQPTGETERALDELVELSLLEEAPGDRVRCHDLLRSYAGLRLRDEEPPEEVHATRQRLRDWLLSATVAAGQWFEPGPPADGSPAEPHKYDSADEADEWLRAEADSWLAALTEAAQAGDHRRVVDVAESLHWYSDRWPYWTGWHEVYALSTEAARRLSDDRLQAIHLGYLAWTRLLSVVDLDLALQHADEAFELARRAGDQSQMGWAQHYRTWALRDLHRYEESLVGAQEAVRCFTDAADWDGLPQALVSEGYALLRLDRPLEAIAAFERLAAVVRDPATAPSEAVRPIAEAGGWYYSAEVHFQLGRWDAAVQAATDALATPGLYPTAPVRSNALRLRARSRRELGDVAAARADLETVLEIARVTGNEDRRREVEEELRTLPPD